MAAECSAPALQIPAREVVAVEHPMVIQNIDKGLKTFGNGKPFERIMHVDDPEGCLPLYLRPNDPMCVPILSHNSSTANVLIKITVPKRIGKRKRGSQEPFLSVTQSGLTARSGQAPTSSQLLKSLRDNPGQYEVEPIAEIDRTHRFRGLADFHGSSRHTVFGSKLNDFVLPGEVEKMRQFKFDMSRIPNTNEELMPPPVLTNQTLPFNWGWHQNPQVTVQVDESTGKSILFHNEKRPSKGIKVDYCGANVDTVPKRTPYKLPEDPGVLEVIAKLTIALNERPIWSRRALGNRLGHERMPVPIIQALPYVAYQFKGGPFRDAVIKYGVDPRSDSKYRMYQTVFFRIEEEDDEDAKEAKEKGIREWRDFRTSVNLRGKEARKNPTTHIFDGKTFTLDGRVWQLCDITDPLLARLIKEAPLREKFEPESDGYFNNGTWAKIHGIMKIKLLAIRAQVTLEEADFHGALNVEDLHENNEKKSRQIRIPVPHSTPRIGETPPDAEAHISNQFPLTLKTRKQRRKTTRIEQKKGLLQPQKRKYIRKKPLPPQSLPGFTRKKQQELAVDAIHSSSKEFVHVSEHGDDGELGRDDSTSAGYQTAEENLGGEDIQRESDEGAEDLDGEDEIDGGSDDESGHDDKDDELGLDEEGDEDEYDSDVTDVVDLASQGPLHSKLQHAAKS